jgi:hypothetical protein
MVAVIRVATGPIAYMAMTYMVAIPMFCIEVLAG